MIHDNYEKRAGGDSISSIPARKEKSKAVAWRNSLCKHRASLNEMSNSSYLDDEYHAAIMEMDCIDHLVQMGDFYDFCVDYMIESKIKTVVDIGCAYGHQSETFLMEGLTYIGIEVCNEGRKWNSDKCHYIDGAYPCIIPANSRFAVSNMCFEYFINDYKILARDFDTVILSGLGEKAVEAEKYFNIEKVNYMPLFLNEIMSLYILKKRRITNG